MNRFINALEDALEPLQKKLGFTLIKRHDCCNCKYYMEVDYFEYPCVDCNVVTRDKWKNKDD